MLAAAFIVYVIIYVVVKPARKIKILEEKASLENKSSVIVLKKITKIFMAPR